MKWNQLSTLFTNAINSHRIRIVNQLSKFGIGKFWCNHFKLTDFGHIQTRPTPPPSPFIHTLVYSQSGLLMCLVLVQFTNALCVRVQTKQRIQWTALKTCHHDCFKCLRVHFSFSPLSFTSHHLSSQARKNPFFATNGTNQIVLFIGWWLVLSKSNTHCRQYKLTRCFFLQCYTQSQMSVNRTDINQQITTNHSQSTLQSLYLRCKPPLPLNCL